jgi:hypothetical protein
MSDHSAQPTTAHLLNVGVVSFEGLVRKCAVLRYVRCGECGSEGV